MTSCDAETWRQKYKKNILKRRLFNISDYVEKTSSGETEFKVFVVF